MLSIWKTPAAAAGEWCVTWPKMECRSAVTGCETSCTAWGYRRLTRNLAPQSLEIHPGVSPAWWINPEFCLEALEMALEGGRQPEIFHSDQGCQFTSSSDFVARLQAEEIKISWSGRKRCYDNILVERLSRMIKYVAEGFSAQPSRGLFACL